jgi:hypothetical protein
MPQLARRILAHGEAHARAHAPADGPDVGPAAAAGVVAAVVEQAVARLYGQLEPLIGPMGYLALLMRALHLAQARAPWLEGVEAQVGQVVALGGLRERASAQGLPAMREGGTALLEHLLVLLCTFLGEDLTMRRLRRAWPELVGEDGSGGGGGAAGPGGSAP